MDSISHTPLLTQWFGPTGTALILIALAEIGDKSQLVCMALAAKHRRAGPVIAGALAAFALLNGLAVMFGAALAAWLPENWILIAVAILFAVFGIKAWRDGGGGDDADTKTVTGRGLVVTAFMLIFVAELGDKTQLSVAALSGLYPPLPIWLGATAALGLTSWLGAVAGKTLLSRLPVSLLHRISGVLFLILAGVALAALISD